MENKEKDELTKKVLAKIEEIDRTFNKFAAAVSELADATESLAKKVKQLEGRVAVLELKVFKNNPLPS